MARARTSENGGPLESLWKLPVVLEAGARFADRATRTPVVGRNPNTLAPVPTHPLGRLHTREMRHEPRIECMRESHCFPAREGSI